MRLCLCITLFAATAFQTAFASDSENAGHLIERQTSCVTCPVNPPACPSCPDGQVCQIISQSCTQCAQSVCISSASLGSLQPSATATASSGPNMGALAGGIVGAVVVVACLAGGLFWFLRKKRRPAEELWLENTQKLEEDDQEKNSNRQTTTTTATTASSLTSSHLSISTTMTRGSNVIPIGYVPSTLRSTMLSTDTSFTHDSRSTFPSHPPTQFFSADDILRSSVATRRDTNYSERDSVRDSVGTTYTRASYNPNAYRSTAIIAPAPVPVAVRGLQPKIVTFGKRSSQSPQPSPVPAVPQLTAEKVEAAERHLAASRQGHVPSMALSEGTSRSVLSTQGLDIPISIQLGTPRGSTATTLSPLASPRTVQSMVMSSSSSAAAAEKATSPFEDEVPESPVLGEGEAESFPNTPTLPPPRDIRITFTPDSPTSSIFDDSKEITSELQSRQTTADGKSSEPRQ